MHKKGWTLSELMISMAIIAIIFVVLTPVITRRFEEDIRTGVTQNDTRLFTYDPDDPDCTSESANSLICKFTVPMGVKKINAILASGGGGGAGATQSNPLLKTDSITSNATTSAAKEIKITHDMKNFVVSYLAGGGGGGGGAAYKMIIKTPPTSQTECNKYGARYLTAAQNGGKSTCVMKRNIGDISGVTNGGMASDVRKVTGGCSASDKCCWTRQKTAKWCDNAWSSYGGCNRTVCNWNAGDSSCKNLAISDKPAGEWRMPRQNEMLAWKANLYSISRNLNDSQHTLSFCDLWNGYGTTRCSHYPGHCGGECHPYAMVSETKSGSGVISFYSYGGSGLLQSTSGYDMASSIRCVLNLDNQYTSSSGGGGGGAPYFKNYSIPQNIIDSSIGGKIVLYSGAGGTGKASAGSEGSSGTDGTSGSESYIYVYDSSNVLKWGLKTPGGNGGKGASSTSGGTGGAQKAVNTCQMYNGTAWVNANCTGAGTKGGDGQSAAISDDTTAATGGAGGGSMYNSDNYSGGGTGGSASVVNGSKGSLWGSGGGGATVTFDADKNAIKGTGGNGQNGIAEIKYDFYPHAAGGGGGGGGSIGQVTDIEVVGLGEYVVKVGGGGKGGAITASGENGGESSISVNGQTYSVYGGKGGNVGVTETLSAAVVQGTGGAYGTYSSNIKSNDIKKGKNGSNASTTTIDTYKISSGGQGGESASGTKGSCGGLYNNTLICVNNNVDGVTVSTFEYPAGVFKAISYGSAGAGGGGGGWSSDTSTYPNPGAGANGQNGYVYIYWTKQN